MAAATEVISMTGFNRKIRLRGKVDEDRYFAKLDQQRLDELHAKQQRSAAAHRNSPDAGDSNTGDSNAPDGPSPDKGKS